MIEELKQAKIPEDSKEFMTEEQVRVMINESSSNFTEVMRVKKQINVGTDNKIIIDGVLGQIQFYKANSQYGYIMTDSSLNMLYVAKDTHFFFDQSSNYIAKLYRASGSDYGLELVGGGKIQFTSGSVMTDTGSVLDIDRTMTINGDVALDAGKKFQVGTTGGIDFDDNAVDTFSINIVGGIVTQFTKNS